MRRMKVKPCGKCGRVAGIAGKYDDGRKEYYLCVSCDGCGATSERYYCGERLTIKTPIYNQIVMAWNKEQEVIMNEKAKEARRRYKREWNRKNRDKVKAAQERYWLRKAAENERAADPTDEQPRRQEV